MKRLVVLVMASLLGACSLNMSLTDPQEVYVVKAVGLGVLPPDPNLTLEQAHALGVKASKMDAYRSLAEKVYGMKIKSNVSVRQLAVRDEHLKGTVEGVLKMAEVVEVKPLLNGTAYETTMQVYITHKMQSEIKSAGFVVE